VGHAASALSGDTAVQFSVSLPLGSKLSETLLSATGNLAIDDGVTLVDPSGATAISNAGPGTTDIVGVGTLVGSNTAVKVVSVAPLSLSNNAVISGSVLTTVPPAEQAGAVINGAVTLDSTLSLPSYTWNVTFPGATQGDVDLEPDTAASLTPGAYGNLAVKSRATLTLAAGTYTFASLDLEPQGVIQSDTTTTPLVVYVQNSLVLHSSIVPSVGAASFFLGYAGTQPVVADATFSGTFVAPNASSTLGVLNVPSQHSGAFFGQSLEFRPRTQVTHVPFSGWSTLIPLEGPSGPPIAPTLSLPAAEQPPPLNVADDVPSFLLWAYQARPSQLAAGRSIIQGAVGNESIAAAIVTAMGSDPDLGDNLVAISILGELRTQAGFNYFQTLVSTPLPTTGTFSTERGGMPLEAIALAKQQARAIDGLMLMLTPAADAAVLNAISTTTSYQVRARAVHDYLWVHGPSGRATVSALLTPDQQILMDRFDMAGAAQSYDTRLATFLSQHPEVVPAPVTP